MPISDELEMRANLRSLSAMMFDLVGPTDLASQLSLNG